MKRILFYPYLVAIYPFFNIYAVNIHKLYGFSDLIIPFVVALTAVTVIYLLSYFFFQDFHQAALFTSVFLFLFFSYGHVHDFVQDELHIERFNDNYLLPIWGLALLTTIKAVMRWGHLAKKITSPLTLFALVLLVFPAWTILFQTKNDLKRSNVELSLQIPETFPDIYYIILDAYPRSDVLNEFYGYDNSEFITFLENNGFYVADKSETNYPYTNASLASALNLNYIDGLIELDPESWDATPLNHLIQDNVLCNTLSQIGYYYIIYDNAWDASSRSDCTDIVRGYARIDELSTILLQTTVLRPFVHKQIVEDRRQTQLFILEDLENVAKLKQATFTFAHVILPHPPFIFDRDGNWPQRNISDVDLWLDDSIAADTASLMVDQTVFTTQKIMEAIEQILKNSDIPPIIILQSDHGPYTQVKWELSEAFLRERMPILNAYYLPDGEQAVLYPSISPINSFRLILNQYFAANLPYLDDKQFYAESLRGRFYQYMDITSELIYEGKYLHISKRRNTTYYSITRDSVHIGEFFPEQPLQLVDFENWRVHIHQVGTELFQFIVYFPSGHLAEVFEVYLSD